MSLCRALSSALIALALCPCLSPQAVRLDNKPERLEWFQDQGLGLFIHWSADSQLGTIISHTLAGSSRQYQAKFYNDLPQTFAPSHFDPDALARLARLSGFRYMVFTTKHHNGFAMWDTKSTDLSITHTPYAKDITRELFDSFRKQGVPPGVYFSPDDFHWLYENGKEIQRQVPDVQPSNNPGLLKLDRQQMTELMTQYGPVATVFFDGESKALKDIAWNNQPDTVVTRGAIETPEQSIPGAALTGAWEACMTMGTAWGWQPSDEHYKSVSEIIRLLVQTRARGGNLLLNIGPAADGSLPVEQEEHLRTLGSWLFINGDAIYGVRPWTLTNEGDIWFTRSKDHHALYAIVDDWKEGQQPWKRGTWRDFVLKSVKATPKTTAGVLGQSDQLVEYRPDLHPQSTWHQEADGLHVRVMRAQRVRDSDQWEYPTVIRLTDVEEAIVRPSVQTVSSSAGRDGVVTLTGQWTSSGDIQAARAGFQYRDITGEDTKSRQQNWHSLDTQIVTRPGRFTSTFKPEPGHDYEFRAVLQHPLATFFGEAIAVDTRRK